MTTTMKMRSWMKPLAPVTGDLGGAEVYDDAPETQLGRAVLGIEGVLEIELVPEST